MCLRWTAAGMLEAETRFRKVKGYRGLAQLAVAIEPDLTAPHATRSSPPPSMCNHQPRTAVTESSTTSGSAPRLLEVDD